MTRKERPLRWKWQDAWATDRNVPDSIARTLVCCQVFMNSDSALMWASEKQLAEARGLSERQVSRHLEKIVELGYFRIHAKGGGTVMRRINGQLQRVGRTTEYALVIPGHPECQGTPEVNSDISDPILGHLEGDSRTFGRGYSDIWKGILGHPGSPRNRLSTDSLPRRTEV